MSERNITSEVRNFYDRVGWQQVSDGVYQNARYEDLRPVSHEYISRCHMRVKRHLPASGKYLLDAGSGPIQYPEYLTYSEDFNYRVCLDLSIVALQEARKRIGDKGLFVVADVAHLPFAPESMEGLVSLHTLHHLPLSQQKLAYLELYRVLAAGGSGVIVNGWTQSELMEKWRWLVRLMERIMQRISGRKEPAVPKAEPRARKVVEETATEPQGTYIEKLDADWLKRFLSKEMRFAIYVWRSVNVRFMRAVIHEKLAGRQILRWLYRQEEKNPVYYGEKGQYPLIVIYK